MNQLILSFLGTCLVFDLNFSVILTYYDNTSLNEICRHRITEPCRSYMLCILSVYNFYAQTTVYSLDTVVNNTCLKRINVAKYTLQVIYLYFYKNYSSFII